MIGVGLHKMVTYKFLSTLAAGRLVRLTEVLFETIPLVERAELPPR